MVWGVGGLDIQNQNIVGIKIILSSCLIHSNVPNTAPRRQSTQSEKESELGGNNIFCLIRVIARRNKQIHKCTNKQTCKNMNSLRDLTKTITIIEKKQSVFWGKREGNGGGDLEISKNLYIKNRFLCVLCVIFMCCQNFSLV